MKKFSLITLLAIAVNIVTAQDIDEVKKFAFLMQADKAQAAKAKDVVDKFLTVEKNAKKPEGWFYKGYIYNQLSKDPAKTVEQNGELKAVAFDALKKYREMDAKAELLQDQNNGSFFDLYAGYYSDLGVKAYTDKNVAAANDNFKKALAVHDYIVVNNITGNNGFKFSALDTTLVLYIAITAGEIKKADEAAEYYKKLTDAGVSDIQYIDAYQAQAEYYKSKKDRTAFADILSKGRKLFPKNEEYWMALEIEEAVEGVVKPAVFQNYEELMAKHPDNYTAPYNYGVELYHYIYSDEMKNANTNEFKAKLVETMKKAIAVKPTLEANFLLANFLYNNSIDVADEGRKIKGAKPDDIKKRKALEAESIKSMNDAVPYAGSMTCLYASIAKPKSSEKINYKQSLVILKNIYEVKKDVAKMTSYDNLIKDADNNVAPNANQVCNESKPTNQNIANNYGGSNKIKMESGSGVYFIPCKLNGLALNFIFDSGASDVSISLTEALFMIKNGYLSKNDIVGKSNYQNADGEIKSGTNIIIKDLQIGNKVIHDVKASIVENLNAPLLLGQSALIKFGKFSFDYGTSILILGN